MELTPYSKELLDKRGKYHATYMYRCKCSLDEVQLLHINHYPKIGK